MATDDATCAAQHATASQWKYACCGRVHLFSIMKTSTCTTTLFQYYIRKQRGPMKLRDEKFDELYNNSSPHSFLKHLKTTANSFCTTCVNRGLLENETTAVTLVLRGMQTFAHFSKFHHLIFLKLSVGSREYSNKTNAGSSSRVNVVEMRHQWWSASVCRCDTRSNEDWLYTAGAPSAVKQSRNW